MYGEVIKVENQLQEFDNIVQPEVTVLIFIVVVKF
jgi:hypothetical protein